MPRSPSPRTTRSDRQPRAALAAAALDRRAARARSHPRTEAVRAGALALLRLVGSLHSRDVGAPAGPLLSRSRVVPKHSGAGRSHAQYTTARLRASLFCAICDLSVERSRRRRETAPQCAVRIAPPLRGPALAVHASRPDSRTIHARRQPVGRVAERIVQETISSNSGPTSRAASSRLRSRERLPDLARATCARGARGRAPSTSRAPPRPSSGSGGASARRCRPPRAASTRCCGGSSCWRATARRAPAAAAAAATSRGRATRSAAGASTRPTASTSS